LNIVGLIIIIGDRITNPIRVRQKTGIIAIAVSHDKKKIRSLFDIFMV